MASRSVNRVELLGHLGSDADVKFTPNGKQYAMLSIATSRRWKPEGASEWKEETDWHRCVLWSPENVAGYLVKGKQVWIEGRLHTRSYEDGGEKKYVTEIVVGDLILLGGGSRESA